MQDVNITHFCRKAPKKIRVDPQHVFYATGRQVTICYFLLFRIPTAQQHDWIIENCRKAWEESAGYRPEYYENWNECPSLTDTTTSSLSFYDHTPVLDENSFETNSISNSEQTDSVTCANY